MRISIIGAGPAGLYLAYLLKRRRVDLHVRIFEQNRADATFGFGVVFSHRALQFLEDDDPETYAAIRPHLESWQDIALVHRGQRIRIDGVGFAAVGRLQLLTLLQARVRSVGVEPAYECRVASLGDLADADLIVGADGVNSLVRRSFEHELGTRLSWFTNRFAWFGTTKPFETLTQTFRRTAAGYFNAHHYRYASGMSTFIVETDAATFCRAGLAETPECDAKRLCEEVFADDLAGHPLISNNSLWRQFPRVCNARWSHGNHVLIGDALHTAHFSIGSGTRLAMEDAIALDRALAQHPRDLGGALAAFEAARRPVVEKLVAASDASGEWYEHFADHMTLEPMQLAMNYITRSGRLSRERLRAISPAFVSRYEQEAVAKSA